MDPEKLKVSTTTNQLPPVPGYENTAAPGPIDPRTGMHTAYWVLTEEERKKGRVRPFRDRYKHVGLAPKYPTRDLTAEEHAQYDVCGYVAFEEYPAGSDIVGCYWNAAQLATRACGTVTTMSYPLAATYATDPSYYGSTFCVQCKKHFPVAEFVWEPDGSVVGS